MTFFLPNWFRKQLPSFSCSCSSFLFLEPFHRALSNWSEYLYKGFYICSILLLLINQCSHAEMWAKFNLLCWVGTCTSAAVNPTEENVFGMWALITAHIFSLVQPPFSHPKTHSQESQGGILLENMSSSFILFYFIILLLLLSAAHWSLVLVWPSFPSSV